MALATGTVIDGRYRLVRQIAVGGMGEVWEAADTRLARRVAVKVLKAELSHDTEFLHRFRIEARTTASINHAGIAAVHDYGETESGGVRTAYLVMELVDGEPLSARLSAGRRLSPADTLDVLEQAGHALQAAHERGFVHRDVKPGNILILPDGRVKLTDFGIAKAANAVPMTRSGMVMGTAQYIAPEQAMGGDAGPTGDVYSLGIVGYECLAGQRPFNADNPVEVALMQVRDSPAPLPAGVPAGVRALIDAALVKDPRLRYATGGEFAAAAAAVRAGRPLPTPAGGGPAVPPEPAGTAAPSVAAPQAPSGAGGRGVLVVLFALLTLAALVVGAIVVTSALGRLNNGTAAPAATPAATPPPDSVVVTPSALTGRSAAAAVTELRGMGLRTTVVDSRGRAPADTSRCTVLKVSPSGAVAKGTVVTISCEERAR